MKETRNCQSKAKEKEKRERTHSSLESVVAHVTSNLIPLRHSVHSIERLHLIPVDEKSAGLFPELVHVEEDADGNH